MSHFNMNEYNVVEMECVSLFKWKKEEEKTYSKMKNSLRKKKEIFLIKFCPEAMNKVNEVVARSAKHH